MRRFTSLRCASVARRWLALACLLAAPLAGAAEVPAAAPARIDIGVLTVLDGEDTQRLWQPLADGLARALPGHSVHLQVVTIPRQSRGHSGCEPLKAAVRGR